MEQAQLAIATEHTNWLRDKRSDLYVEGIRSLHEASVLRAGLIKAGTDASLLRDEVARILQSYSESAWHDRLARAEAYLPEDASAVYLSAAEGDWHMWRAVQASLSASDEMELVLTDEIANDLRKVHQATKDFSELARRDLLRLAVG